MNRPRKIWMAYICIALVCITGCQSKQTVAPDLVESPYEVILTRPVVSGNIGQYTTVEANIRSKRTYYYIENEFESLEYKKHTGDLVKKGDVIAVTNQKAAQDELDALESSASELKQNYENQKKSMELDIKLMELEFAYNEKSIKKLQEELENWVKDPESDRTKKDIKEEIKALKERNKELTKLIADTKNTIQYNKDSLNLSLIPIHRQIQQLKDKMAEGSIIATEDGMVVLVNEYAYNDSLVAITENQKDYYIATSSKNANLISDYTYAVIGGKFYPLTRVYDDSNAAKKVVKYGIAQPVMFEFANGLPAELDISDSVLLCSAKEYKEDVLIVSNDSIYAMDTNPYVYVLENGVKVRRDITLGIQTKTESEVVTGLSEGELVCYESGDMPPLEVKETYTVQYEDYVNTGKFSGNSMKSSMTFFEIQKGETLVSCSLMSGDTFKKGDTLYTYRKKVSQADILEAKNAITSAQNNFKLQEKDYLAQKEALEKVIAESSGYEKNKAKLELEKLNLEFGATKKNFESQIASSKKVLNDLLTEQNGIAVKAEFDGIVKDTNMTAEMCGIPHDNLDIAVHMSVSNTQTSSIGYYSDVKTTRNFAKATIYFSNGETASAKLLNCYTDGESNIEFSDEHGNSYGSWGMEFSNAPDVIPDNPEVLVNFDEGTYVEFEMSHIKSVIILPKTCIQKDDSGSFVWVQSDDTYIKRYIQMGTMSTNEGMVVVSGLALGDVVAILKD